MKAPACPTHRCAFAEVARLGPGRPRGRLQDLPQVVRARRGVGARARRRDRQGSASHRGPGERLRGGGPRSGQGRQGSCAKHFFEQQFHGQRRGPQRPAGLLTGYYEPHLEGSRTPQGAFQTPIYKRPPDLVNLVDETQRGAVGAALTHARKTDKGVEPYRTRAADRAGRAQGQGVSSCSISPIRSRCSSCRSRGRAASS